MQQQTNMSNFTWTPKETLRTALAMGADRGIHVLLNDKEYEGLQPLAVAKIFAKITEQENPNLIILGKQVLGACCLILGYWKERTKQSFQNSLDGKYRRVNS